MQNSDLLPAWGHVLSGRRPFLSIELTRECPLRCPGCYAYEPGHLGGAGPLRDLGDLSGDALVAGVLALVQRHRPIHVSIVGGEPLVRYRELEVLLPRLSEIVAEILLVTSAVRPIPIAWKDLPNLYIAVSIDGLQPEHDRRRAPATYDRILKNIAGHRIFVHCTITRQIVRRPNYLREFAAYWAKRDDVRRVWFSLYTPQEGEQSEERLTPRDRMAALDQLRSLRRDFPEIELSDRTLEGFLHPPESPQECMFAQTTTCISADLSTRIAPCQFGGRPVCSECGCIASAGLASFGKVKLAPSVRISDVFTLSRKIGDRWATMTNRDAASPVATPRAP